MDKTHLDILLSQGRLLNRQLEEMWQDPTASQCRYLMSVLRRNADTHYGKSFSFARIQGEKEFKNAVPIVEYTDIEPFIERMGNGESNVLTSETVSVFARTSATTDRPKLIPMTPLSIKNNQDLVKVWLYRALSNHPRIFDSDILVIAAAANEGVTSGGITFGSATGINNANLPAAVSSAFAAPADIAHVQDYKTRYYLLSRFAYARKLSFIAAPSPLTLVRLAEMGKEHGSEIVRAIRNGWLSDDIRSLDSCERRGLPSTIWRDVRPDKERAKYLNRILEDCGQLMPSCCWPELSLIGCWLGGSIGRQSQLLDPYYGSIPKRDLGYMASEGSFSVPYADASAQGILALGNNYYEFIPEDEDGNESSETLSAVDLEKGRSYRVILTNDSGLYRYNLNDIIKVEDILDSGMPLIAFVRKGENMLSIAGEKLHLNHFLQVFEKIQSQHSLFVTQFRVVANENELRYDLFISLNPQPTQDYASKYLLPELDSMLGAVNIEYHSKRVSSRLNSPCIHVMSPEWEETLRRDCINRGMRDVQFKWKSLSDSFVESDHPHVIYKAE